MSLRALGATVPRLTRAALAKRGGALAALIGDWSTVVGPALAAASIPEGLTPATRVLRLRVEGAAAVEFQHLEPTIIGNVNRFLGHDVVERLKIVRGPLPKPAAAPEPPPRALAPDEQARIDAAVADIADHDLAASLRRLGATLARRRTGR
ncbi:MAG: DUF721 domain-containing protein [Alphaproteobacteria bacterium]|nr:DUF721 domain-containing protein [Alphaproteobacteria bacterium]